MANFTKILLRYCVPAVITVGLCYLLVRGMDLRQMWETICTQCDFRWIAVNILLLIGAMWARAARWQLQLRALGIKASVLSLIPIGRCRPSLCRSRWPPHARLMLA